MAQRFFSILIMAALMFGFSFVRANDYDAEVPLSELPFRTLTYDQFRRLNDENQMAYMNDIREMLVELDNQGVDVSGIILQLHNSLGSRWTLFLSTLNQPAEAGNCDGYTFDYNVQKGQYCMTRTGLFGMTTCGRDATDQMKYCPDKFNNARLRAEEKMQGNNGKVNPEAQKLNEVSAAEQKKIDAAQKPVDIKPAPHYEAAKAKDVDTNQDKKKKFRCIYAGFTVYGDKCTPQDKYVDPKTNTVYTCKKTGSATEKEMGVVSPTKEDTKKTILCNPAFFGTTSVGKDGKAAPKSGPGSVTPSTVTAKQEPICVEKSKNATKACLDAANKNKEDSLKTAVALAKNDKKTYDEVVQTLNNLCSGSGADATMIGSSKEDMQKTCTVYRSRIGDYVKEYSGRSSSGSRAGSK